MFGLLACSTPVHHGLEEPSANELLTALERSGIGAEKVREEGTGATAFTVQVGRGDAPRAMELLRTLGLPRSKRSGFAEIYGQPSLVPGPTEEKARYLEALASELERTLETIDAVVQARVHLVPTETDPLAADGKPRVPAQAAVLLKVRPDVAPIKEAEVQKLIAGSVPGLLPSAVAVVVTQAPEWAGQAQTLASLGPLRIAPGSKAILFVILAGGLLLVAGLAGLLLVTSRKLATAAARARA